MGGVYNSENINLYHYANNNPIRYNDIEGNWCIDFSISGGIFVGGVVGWKIGGENKLGGTIDYYQYRGYGVLFPVPTWGGSLSVSYDDRPERDNGELNGAASIILGISVSSKDDKAKPIWGSFGGSLTTNYTIDEYHWLSNDDKRLQAFGKLLRDTFNSSDSDLSDYYNENPSNEISIANFEFDYIDKYNYTFWFDDMGELYDYLDTHDNWIWSSDYEDGYWCIVPRSN